MVSLDGTLHTGCQPDLQFVPLYIHGHSIQQFEVEPFYQKWIAFEQPEEELVLFGFRQLFDGLFEVIFKFHVSIFFSATNLRLLTRRLAPYGSAVEHWDFSRILSSVHVHSDAVCL